MLIHATKNSQILFFSKLIKCTSIPKKCIYNQAVMSPFRGKNHPTIYYWLRQILKEIIMYSL